MLSLAMKSTVAYDDLKPPGDDSRWEIFLELHEYLEKRFPLVCVMINLMTSQSLCAHACLESPTGNVVIRS